MSDEGDGASWVETKQRPRPPPMTGASVEVSRASGLSTGTGTFGKSSRFSANKVTGHGHSSPYGHLFYSRNALFKGPLEEGLSCSLGIGPRPGMENKGSGNIGPGSYNIVHSAAGPRSPLDGPEFCSTTIKVKLPSSLTGLPMPSPGPHARYEVRKADLTAHLPQYAKHKPLLGHNDPAPKYSGNNDPGPGHYQEHTYKTTALAASCPNLTGGGDRCMEATGGTKKCLKSTFGMAPRFSKDKVPNSSPQGERYYAHSKIRGGEDYLSGARSCSFGACGKMDMSNPLKGPRNDVSPVTYHPERGYSCHYKTSPLDGLTQRCISPVHQFAKNLGSSKEKKQRPPTNATSPGAGSSASPAGGGDA
jgi:hypothetical protein